MYRRDESVGRDPSIVTKTAEYNLPLRKDRSGAYKVPAGDRLYSCMTSDFFLEEADEWRPECWAMMRARSDVNFVIITKRIHRMTDCLPLDWGNGYPNVTVCSTCENQDRADARLPILLDLPIAHREIICEPMLGPVHIEQYLVSGKIEHVTCGGESGDDARPCHYEWILSMREQCIAAGVPFYFKQTGACFVKDGRTYRVERCNQLKQADRAGINWPAKK